MSETSETETVDYWRERVAKIGSPVDALFVLGREYSDPESSLLTSEAILAVVEEIRSSLEAGVAEVLALYRRAEPSSEEGEELRENPRRGWLYNRCVCEDPVWSRKVFHLCREGVVWCRRCGMSKVAPAFAGSTTDGVCYEPERDGPAPEEERKYPCDLCGKLRSKAEGGTVFTVCDECWDATYRRTAPAREAVGEDAVDKLARIHDWLKYEANSEGGMGQEIRDTLRRLRASAPGR